MAKKITKVHIKSALPIYGAAAIFFILSLILPIYKLWAIIAAGAVSAGGWFGLTRVFPGRDEEIVEDVLTGNKELDEQIRQSREMLERFRDASAKAGDATVSAQINRIANAAEGIVEEVIQDAGDRGDAYTFFIYYMPTLDKLLSFYTGFALTDKGENAVKSRERIENCLEMVASAFEKFLDKLYHNEAIEIKASIDVLKTMLSADGLTTKSGAKDPARDIEMISDQLREEASREQRVAVSNR